MSSTRPEDGAARRGNIVVLAAAAVVMIFGFAAFSLDVGFLALTKTQMQLAADASVLAAAQELPDAWGLGASITSDEATTAGRQIAVSIAAAHRSGERNSAYISGTRDVRFGRRDWDASSGSWSESWGVAPYNLVEVTVHRDVSGGQGDGPVPLFVAPVIGHTTASLSVSAVAALMPGVGFRIPAGSNQTVGILPFTLDEFTWNEMLNGVGADNYNYNPDTGGVTSGSDGILEINLYPHSNTTLPPGNRGTVDFGSANNSTADIARQILHGLNASDLSYFGGEIRFDNGPLSINGDTGISAGFKEELASIIGKPRAIPIFTQVSGPGNNAMYTIVKFVGIRVLSVKLTGGSKYVMIQPAPFVDSSVIYDNSAELVEESLMSPPILLR
jgi:hypothetical protein